MEKEKRDYMFYAYNLRGSIKFELIPIFRGITKEMAQYIRMGIVFGLAQKYKGGVCVEYVDITDID